MLTKEYIEKYFLTEKQDGLMLMIAGVVAIALAVFLLIKGQDDVSKGISIVLIASGIWQMMMGYPGFMHSDAHRIEMVYAYDMNPEQLRAEEMPRIEKVLKSFRNYRIMEFSIFLIGLALIFIFFFNEEKQLWYGVGLGLSLQSFVVFILDYYAGKRTEEYLLYLKTFVVR